MLREWVEAPQDFCNEPGSTCEEVLGKSSWFKRTKKVSKEGAKVRTNSKHGKKDVL